MWERCNAAGPIGNTFGTRMQIGLHVNRYRWQTNYPLETPEELWGIRGHLLNCGKTATNTCIIMLRLSLAKPGNPASSGYNTEMINKQCNAGVPLETPGGLYRCSSILSHKQLYNRGGHSTKSLQTKYICVDLNITNRN